VTDSAAAAVDARAPAAGRRARSIAVWTLLVLAGLFLLLGSFAAWVDRVALDTEVFVDTSSELLDDDAIRSVVAARAVDELFDNVDVQAEIEGQLPDDLQSLSGPAAAGLRQASYQLVDRALERPALQRLWAASLRETHRTLVDVLEDDVAAVSTSGGVVTLDLESLVLETADRIGIRSQVEDKLPANVGSIEILRSDELDAAQDGFQSLKTLAWILPVLMLLAFAGAVWLASDRRRAARSIGAVVLVVGVVGLVAVGLVGSYLVDSLTSETEVETAASDAWDILTELLRATFRSLIALGILFLVAAWLAGPGHRAVASRRVLTPVVRERVWPYAAVGVVALVLLVGGPVSDFTRLLFVVVLVALGVAWIELMRRQTLREFPDVTGYGSLVEARDRLSAWIARQRELRGERRPPTRAGATAPSDLASRLALLADLHARGELTDSEYGAAKSRVLAGE
jgi:hypothetical protein